MGGVLNPLLTLLLVYGYPVVGGVELASSAGVPLPMTAILLASGSLAALGDLNLPLLCLVTVIASITGDCIDYTLGRRLGTPLLEALERRSIVSKSATERARRQMQRWSGASVFLSRWLFTPLSSLVSLLAGTSAYPLRRFLLADVAGNVIGAVLYLGAGYLVGANWVTVWSNVSGAPLLATIFAAGALLFAVGVFRLLRLRGGRQGAGT
jgi:membrane-associated protein